MCVCVCVVLCCCYLCYFSEFLPCLCVTNTLAQQKTAARRWRRRLSAIATATLVWSLIQAVWPLSALLSCSFALRFRLLRFVQSAVVFYSVCDAVVFSL